MALSLELIGKHDDEERNNEELKSIWEVSQQTNEGQSTAKMSFCRTNFQYAAIVPFGTTV